MPIVMPTIVDSQLSESGYVIMRCAQSLIEDIGIADRNKWVVKITCLGSFYACAIPIVSPKHWQNVFPLYLY